MSAGRLPALRGSFHACSLALLSLTASACQRDEGLVDPSFAGARSSASVQPLQAASSAVRTVPGSYVVTFHRDVTDVPGLASQLSSSHGGTLRFTYTHALKGFAADLPAQAVEGLRHNPHVAAIQQDQIFEADALESPAPWGLDRIDQRDLPLDRRYDAPATGKGVTAYIIDTGIRFTHVDFGGRAVFGFDAFGGLGTDCNGHGTHVAGTVGGSTYGVAKDVGLVAVRVLNCSGAGSTSTVLAGIDWVVAHARRPAVANLSLGGSVDTLVDAAVRRLVQTGVAVAVAAGNAATDACFYSPARVPEAMTVAASDSTDAAASFSNFGPCVDWYAPGVAITSDGYLDNVATAVKSGTSMASPHTAGVAALYLEQNPTAGPEQVAAALADGTTKRAVSAVGSLKGGTQNGDLIFAAGTSSTIPTSSPPTAAFTAACSASTCAFTDQSSDADGTVASWQWEFGDQSTGSATSPSHTYAAPGTYRVTLVVRDDAGNSGTTFKDVVAGAPPGNVPPSAGFSSSCARLACEFADGSLDPDGTLSRWEWTYGDGASSIDLASTQASHTFTSSGVYRVSLTVTDDAGATSTASKDLSIGVMLRASVEKVKGKSSATLTWSGAESAQVAIYLDGTLLKTMSNTGSFSYRPAARTQATYRFKVCEAGVAAPVCSGEQQVTI